jgi:SAM-dependent methyltransferase
MGMGQEDHIYLFQKSLPLQVRLQEVRRAMGNTEGLACLEIGAENGMFSLQLRKHGGKWKSFAADEETAQAVGEVVQDEVHVLKDGVLPFNKKIFDIIVVVNFLERHVDDVAFIEQCHKALNPEGRFIVVTNRLGAFMPMRMLRHLLGMTEEKEHFVRPGYSESDLFDVLKSGFDVHLVRPYSRCLTELTRAFIDRLAERPAPVGEAEASAHHRLHMIGGVIYKIVYQLDFLMLMSRGYSQIAVAKRRSWKSRKPPILVDGRSISEVVLSRPAG